MARTGIRLLATLLAIALLLPLAPPAAAQPAEYITTPGVVRFGFVLSDGRTVHYRLPINLKSTLDGVWNSSLADLNEKVKAGARAENGSLYDMSSRLSLAEKATLQVRQEGDTIWLRYVVRDNNFRATVEIDGFLDLPPDPSFTVDYTLALELGLRATDLSRPLAVVEARANVDDSEVDGDNFYSDIALGIGQLLFGAESKIERRLDAISIDMTDQVNGALAPATGVLSRYVPAGFGLIDASVDGGGTLSLCLKRSPEQRCSFPDSLAQPPFTFPPVLTSAAALRAPDLGPWHRDVVPVALSTVGGSGPGVRTLYRIDGGPEAEATGPVSIADDGIHALTYYSLDSTGEREPDQTLTVQVDRTPPAVSLTASGDPTELNGWINQASVATIGLADPVSGLAQASLELYRDGQLILAAPSGGAAFPPVSLVDDGVYAFRVSASDNAGNSSTFARELRLDQRPPQLEIVAGAGGPGLGAAASDSGSGIATVETSADGGGTWRPYTGTLSLTPSLLVRACDLAGNCATLDAQLRDTTRGWLSTFEQAPLLRSRLGPQDAGDAGVATGATALKVKGHGRYTVEGAVLTADPQMRLRLELRWFTADGREITHDAGGKALKAADLLTAPGATGPVSASFVAPADAAYGRFLARAAGVGSILIDDLALRDSRGRNLLPNGDFAAGLGEPWQVGYWEKGFGEVRLEPAGADSALRVTLRPTWASDSARLLRSREAGAVVTHRQSEREAFAAAPGVRYEFAAAAQLTEVDALALEVAFYDARGQFIGREAGPALAGTAAWQWLRLEATAPAGAATARAQLTLRGKGTVIADAVVVTAR